MKKIFLTILLLLGVFANLLAQQTVVEQVPMADKMREDGKIWVVVAIIAVIFAGIIAYLIRTDRKLSKLEKQLKKWVLNFSRKERKRLNDFLANFALFS